VALAWTLTRGSHVVPVPGTKRLRYVEENVAASALVLTQEDLAELRSVPPSAAPRY
jgi:aryl-alcohol dehydrogenase-like predicted oxidoreductase